MNKYLKRALDVVFIICFALTLICGALALVGELLHPPQFEELLNRLPLPMTADGFMKFAWAFAIAAFVLIIVKEKFFGKNKNN